MKQLALFGIILCCLRCETVRGQCKIAVADIDTLAAALLSDIRFDSLFRAANALLQDTLAHRKDCWSAYYKQYEKLDMAPPALYETMRRKLESDYEAIAAFEKMIADSLPALREEMLGRCRQLVEKEIEAMAREEGFDLVASSRNVFFYRPETDKTGELRQRISVAEVQTAAREKIKDFLACVQQLTRN